MVVSFKEDFLLKEVMRNQADGCILATSDILATPEIGGTLMKVDVTEYKDQYLKKVEERITAKKDTIPHYTSENLHRAIMTEMNRADTETWEVEVPDDKEQALKEAEQRVIEHLKKSIDLGVGLTF